MLDCVQPQYVNANSAVVYNKAIPPEARDTWMMIRGLTKPLSMADMIAVTGKTKSTLYSHLAILRDSGSLRWASAKGGVFVFDFPENGQLFPVQSDISDGHIKDPPVNEASRVNEGELTTTVRYIGQQARLKPDQKAPAVSVEILRPFVNALADVCQVDRDLNYGRLAREAKALHSAGYTAAQVRQVYGPGGRWYTVDWRGRAGELPGIGVIRCTIKALLAAKAPAAGNGKGKKADPLAEELARRKERLNGK